MNEGQRLGKIVKIAFTAMIVAFVGFLAYNKLGVFSVNENLAKPKSRIASTEISYVLRDSVVDFGMKYLGSPYVVAGAGEKGFDCSGFVYFVYRHFNINVPRSSSEFASFGVEIPIDQIEKGDILLFLSPTRNVIGHIGIVLDGNGKNSNFIHASSGREMKVIISNVATKGYVNRFVKAIRVI